jgi:hypothetical protein
MARAMHDMVARNARRTTMHALTDFLHGAHRHAAAAVLVLTVGACGTETSTTSTWSAQVPAAGPVHSVVVMGANLDQTHRRVLEDRLAASLQAHGVAAKPSYVLFPEALPDREQARATVQGAGFDGVLVARLTRIQESARYIPGNAGFWGGYYDGYYGGWDSGYVVTDTNVNFEVSLWDARGAGNMLWSSTTRTLNPTSSKDFADSLSKEVVPNLQKGGFLPR